MCIYIYIYIYVLHRYIYIYIRNMSFPIHLHECIPRPKVPSVLTRIPTLKESCQKEIRTRTQTKQGWHTLRVTHPRKCIGKRGVVAPLTTCHAQTLAERISREQLVHTKTFQ